MASDIIKEFVRRKSMTPDMVGDLLEALIEVESILQDSTMEPGKAIGTQEVVRKALSQFGL